MAGLQAATAPVPQGQGQMDPNAGPVDPNAVQPTVGENGEEMASPEEQQLYDELVARAYLLMFDEKTQKPRPSVLEMLKGDEPQQDLAEAAAQIFMRVLTEAAKSGIEVSPDVEQAAGTEVFETMAQLASDQGGHDFMGDDEAFNNAFYLAADQLRLLKQDAGMIDQERAQADMAGLAEADQSGELEQLMSQLGGK